MSIYLIRHTTPLIDKGICYGQSDIDVTDSFLSEAELINNVIRELPIQRVYSSPLTRCQKLATHLFPAHPISMEPSLMEIHCGEWEGLHWDAIPPQVIDPWMKDFVNVCIPGGESYVQMHARVTACFDKIAGGALPAAILTHGGVIRSILAHITGTPLADSFGTFKITYGCVIRLDKDEIGYKHQLLHSIHTEKEQHKPSRLQK